MMQKLTMRIILKASTSNSRVKQDLWSFPGGSAVKNPPANAGDMDSIPGPERPQVPWSK